GEFLQFESKNPLVRITGYDYLLEIPAYTDLKTDSSSALPSIKTTNSQNSRVLNIRIDHRDSIQIDFAKLSSMLRSQFEQGLLKREGNNGVIYTSEQSLRIDTFTNRYDLALILKRFNVSNASQADSLHRFSYVANLLL